MPESNPWVTSANADADDADDAPVETVPDPARTSGPTAPQAGITAPTDSLTRRPSTSSARVWWVGVHGGAGERTLSALVEGTRAAAHAWPVSATPERVVLVTRTHARGLLAAQAAATEWASGRTGVELIGLAVIADAPGRLPRPLKELVKLISGGVPRTWHLPWVEAWRLGEHPVLETAPKSVRAMVSDLDQLAPLMK